jgi:transmembrane sensor
MKRPSISPSDTAAIADEAARWLARRDRGLSPAEQDAYMQWLTADPRHAQILAQHAAAFERMMQLYHWQPGQSADANPDLFAPRPLRPWRRWGLSLAAAAALVLGGMLLWREASPIVFPEHPKSYLRVNERRALPDGSVVELKDGSRINLEFSAAERRVHLIGEAHFQVAKNPTPFVVVAGGVALRAVGTAFNVRLDADTVDVLVTEGRVAVATQVSEAGSQLATPKPGEGGEGVVSAVLGSWSEIVAGQRGIVPIVAGAEPRISEASPAEAKEILGWQAPRLQFFETPLAVAVAEFNRHNRTRLVVADRELNTDRANGVRAKCVTVFV